MPSWIPNDHSLRARLASFMPDDIKTLPQLMAGIKYADVGGGDAHDAGPQNLSSSDKKMMQAQLEQGYHEWLKGHPGGTKEDFEHALSQGQVPPSCLGGLSSGQQKNLSSMFQMDPNLMAGSMGA